MDIIEINSLKKRAQRTRTKMSSEILFGKVRHSEVNHLTVTRIVGSHSECQKRVQTYRADLNFTLNNIKREKHHLRHTLAQYGRKLRQNRKDREEREQEMARKEAEMKEQNLPSISEETQNDNENDPEEDETPKSQEPNSLAEEENEVNNDENTDQMSEHVPEIVVEDESLSNENNNTGENNEEPENQDKPEENVHKEEDETTQDQISMEKLTTQLKDYAQGPPKPPEVSTDPSDFGIEMYSTKKRKKPKKNVSYSDIIKLRHSSNTRKLFSLVDKLSKVHGHEENIMIGLSHAKSKEEQTEPARRGSVYYTINYGYDVPEDDLEPVHVPYFPEKDKDVEENTPTLPYNNLFSEADNQFWRNIHKARVTKAQSASNNTNDWEGTAESKAERRRRRASDLPLLVADYSDMKNRNLSNSPDKGKIRHSAKIRQKLPRFLPPMTRGMKF